LSFSWEGAKELGAWLTAIKNVDVYIIFYVNVSNVARSSPRISIKNLEEVYPAYVAIWSQVSPERKSFERSFKV
jgi:hypothetical protein